MKFIRLKAIAWKECIQIFRDPTSLALALSIPVLLLILFGYALTLDVDRIPTVVHDLDLTPRSRDLIDRFLRSKYFQLEAVADNYADLQNKIDRGQALMGLVIPANFSGDLEADRQTTIQILVDGTDANTATIALGYAQAIVILYSQEILAHKMNQLGIGSISTPVEPRIHIWFNPDMESKNFIIPGLIAVIMVILATILTAPSPGSKGDHGAAHLPPIRNSELILGKLVPILPSGCLTSPSPWSWGISSLRSPARGGFAVLLAGAVSPQTPSPGRRGFHHRKNQLLSSQISIVLSYLPRSFSPAHLSIDNMPKLIQGSPMSSPAGTSFPGFERFFQRCESGYPLDKALLLAVYASAMIIWALKDFRKDCLMWQRLRA
jgi:ABC-2 type transport system permease protein